MGATVVSAHRNSITIAKVTSAVRLDDTVCQVTGVVG